jgi:2'-5' RNA ligase superfamily protein
LISCPRAAAYDQVVASGVLESGLVLTVPSVEPVIDRWRVATVEAAAAGGPAHVTALYPWRNAPVPSADLEHLAGVLHEVDPIPLTFDRLDRFPTGVLFLALAPESENAVRRLTQLLVSAYPDHPPYGGEHPDPHPHLTVACGSNDELDELELQVSAALHDLLPLSIIADRLVVMERQASGRWHQGHSVRLGA